MKINNPRNRFDLLIKRGEKVLEVGAGHNPHPRAQVIVDKFVDSNYHRHSDIKILPHQSFMQADGQNLPFANKEFDYVICNQVLEHVDDPIAFLREQSRVAKRGYIETPSIIGEYLFPKEAHRWLVMEINNTLVMVEKERVWFKSNLDFGFLFLTWLQKTSLSYKMLMDTKPNFMTTRYQWRDSIDVIVNPADPELLKYFTSCWSPEMTEQFFPAKSKLAELFDSAYSLSKIVLKGIFRKR